MKLLQTGKYVKWTVAGEKVKVMVPEAMLKTFGSLPALAFEYSVN